MKLQNCKTLASLADYAHLEYASSELPGMLQDIIKRAAEIGGEKVKEAAAHQCFIDAGVYQGGESPSGRLPCERSCAEGEIACRKLGQNIRALDVKQIIEGE